jgi:phage-related baseplate assembly protein
MALPIPNFIERDAQQIIDEMVADYQNRVGRVLEPAQVETLLINALAYRELLLRNQVQQAALQNLLSFSTAPMIDYLGELLGVTRLPSAAAQTTIQFTLVEGHGGVAIPEGIRIGTTDGRAIFVTRAIVNVAAGVNTATVLADCQALGESPNGYAIGTVTTILDPQPYLASATNTTVTGAGSDEESDDELRERIKLAPSAFSTAGSESAYKFHAKGAHPSIVDVTVVGPPTFDPGEVHIFPLVQGGITTPTEVLDAVLQACSAERVRPLTDSVFVESPTKVDYTITVALTLYSGSDQTSVVTAVESQLQEFVSAKKNQLGQDVVRAQIIERCAILGQVYNVVVSQPASDLIIDQTEFSNCTAINITVSGFNNG